MSNYYCLKCSARPSPDCHPDYPMCEAHLIRCERCGGTPEPDTDPPMCTKHLAEEKDLEDYRNFGPDPQEEGAK